nr:SprT family zinc-dependent metalloprotease [Halovulum dunhuangense]
MSPAAPADLLREVEIRRSARARRLTLRMSHATGGFTLTVPQRTPAADIRRFLDQHLWWIEERRAERPVQPNVAPGTLLPVAGEELTLLRGRGRSARRVGDALEVPGEGAVFARRTLVWLREEARARMVARLDHHSARLGRPHRGLTLRDPRSRWGSCTAEGAIMLSWRLILAPAEVMDYVVAHEVAHLAEMNHSPAYWRVVEGLFPGYERPRDWLRANGASLHAWRF